MEKSWNLKRARQVHLKLWLIYGNPLATVKIFRNILTLISVHLFDNRDFVTKKLIFLVTTDKLWVFLSSYVLLW